MPRPRRLRSDANHYAIIRQLEQVPGIMTVDIHSLGRGVGDLLVGYRGHNFLFEIKDPKKKPSARRLTEDEMRFRIIWPGQITTVHSFEAILLSLGITI